MLLLKEVIILSFQPAGHSNNFTLFSSIPASSIPTQLFMHMVNQFRMSYL